MNDDDLRVWAQQVWAAYEVDPSLSIRTMRLFIEDYERVRVEQRDRRSDGE